MCKEDEDEGEDEGGKLRKISREERRGSKLSRYRLQADGGATRETETESGKTDVR